jgi:hypothetical protein
MKQNIEHKNSTLFYENMECFLQIIVPLHPQSHSCRNFEFEKFSC